MPTGGGGVGSSGAALPIPTSDAILALLIIMAIVSIVMRQMRARASAKAASKTD